MCFLFLEEVKLDMFCRLCIFFFFFFFQILLCSDKEAANFSDRTLLKNLGHWLGMLTLARNRPILFRDLALKDLLLEAYKRGLSVRNGPVTILSCMVRRFGFVDWTLPPPRHECRHVKHAHTFSRFFFFFVRSFYGQQQCEHSSFLLLLLFFHLIIKDLLYVVPFVSKVLESCSESLVFQPPCPWVMAILGVLCELHELSDLKLNLKFEVEVLCKHLKVDMTEIKTYALLSNIEALAGIKEQLATLKEKANASGGTVLWRTRTHAHTTVDSWSVSDFSSSSVQCRY